MKALFLKAKHWQLFMLMWVLPIIFQIVLFVKIFSGLAGGVFDEHVLTNYLRIFPFIILFSAAVHFGWVWSVATGLQKYIPKEIDMKTKNFKMFFIFPLVYMSFFMAAGIYFAAVLFKTRMLEWLLNHLWVFVAMIPIQLFVVFCVFYGIYFIAKSLKTAEMQREARFEDYIAEFFLTWFLPVGIWIVQPKINKLAERDTETAAFITKE